MRTGLLSAVLTTSLLFLISALAAQTTADAKAIVAQARTDAAQQHKLVFVIFDASWCSNCRQFDRYLDSPDVHAILDQHFVVVRISAMEEAGKRPERNTPGAAKLLAQYGGGDGVPFFVFLDEKGGVIATSSAPKIGNIGFPVAPEEVDWWMKMLNKAVPSLTPDETRTLRSKLDKKQAAAH
jgi:thioredoxin-related protein